LRGRKSAERPKILRTTEVLCCLFGSGSSGLGNANIAVADNDSSKVTADAINAQAASTGVKATARTAMQLSFTSAGSFSLNLRSDNASVVAISFTMNATTGADALSTAVSAVNDQSAKTGVTANLNADGTAVILTNATGNNILIGDIKQISTGALSAQKMAADTSGNLVAVGTLRNVMVGFADDSVVASGYIVLDSEKSFSTASTSTTALGAAGGGIGSTLKKVADLDVTTFTKATDALNTVDSALAFINGERAKLGALQSRFETSISNLQVTSENLSASRSRIQDADFASETANLSRAQILQQAGTAMVAQANQLPQGVLALLR